MPDNPATFHTKDVKIAQYDLKLTDFVEVELQGKPKRILITIHGIRDDGAWAQNVRIAMNKAGYDHRVCPADYRRFGPLPFVLGLGMTSRCDEVRQGIEKILADHPAAIVDVFCHSNGTKMFVAAAQEISQLTVRNLIFAGSICRNKELEELLHSPNFNVDQIWNECGLKDRWPVIAEALRPDIFQQTGVRGFATNRVTSRFYTHGDHGMAIRPKHFERHIIPILTGNRDISEEVAYVNFPQWAQPTYVRIMFSVVIGAIAMGFWSLPFWGAAIAAAAIAIVYHQWMDW